MENFRLIVSLTTYYCFLFSEAELYLLGVSHAGH